MKTFFLSGLLFLCVLCTIPSCFAQNGQVFAAVEQNGKWGFIDTTGKVQIPFNLDAAGSFKNGIANIKYGGTWGYINKKGSFVLKPIFREAQPFYDNRARISYYDHRDKTLYQGYINKNAAIITLLENYETGYEYHDNLVRILSRTASGMAFGFKDTSDKWAIDPEFDGASDFREGVVAIELSGKWGYIDAAKKMFVYPNYDEAYDYHDGVACVKQGKATSYIDKTGKKLFTVNYDEVSIFMQDSMISFRNREGKIGFMNVRGKTVIKPQFEGKFLPMFKDGLAPVQSANGKFGFIDKKGNFVINPVYDDAALFSNDFAIVKKDGRYGFIDRAGNWVVQPIYDNALEFERADNF